MTGLLLVVGLVLGVVYTIVAGASYGFPRYHFTMLPLWAVAATTACAVVRCWLRCDSRQACAMAPLAQSTGWPFGALSLALWER